MGGGFVGAVGGVSGSTVGRVGGSTVGATSGDGSGSLESKMDEATMILYRQYGNKSRSLLEWLQNLIIPRDVRKLSDIKNIWENGTSCCPPLRDWTVTMRNFKQGRKNNISLYSQRKFLYLTFKSCNFSEDEIMSRYGEVMPGKLYKMLKS